MNRKEAYQKAMDESLANSEMWLKEAKLISKKGCKGHSQALLIFAIEELGKALMCWLTVKGVYPFNHREIDFRSKKSFLQNHDMKSATAIGLSLILSGLEVDTPEQTIIDSNSGEPIKITTLLTGLGTQVTLARFSWMYVDITQKTKGQIEVQSPLEKEPISLKDGIEDHSNSIESFKKFLKMDKEHPENLEATFSNLKDMLKEIDKEYPKNPQWS